MQNIFAHADSAAEQLAAQFQQRDFTYDDLLAEISNWCRAFPKEGPAWPEAYRRGKTSGVAHPVLGLQIRIKIRGALRRNGREYVVHDRMIDGHTFSLKEMAKEAFATILAAKKIAEALTVLEETKCLEAPTS